MDEQEAWEELTRQSGWRKRQIADMQHEAIKKHEREALIKQTAKKCAEIADLAEPYKSADLIRKHFGVDETEKAMQEVQKLGEEIQPDFAYSAEYDAYYYIDTGEWLEPRCGDMACHFCNGRPKNMKEKRVDEMQKLRYEAQPEQKPVAYGMWDTMLGKDNRMMMVRLDKGQDGCTVPLYTTPPQPKEPEQEPVAYLDEGLGAFYFAKQYKKNVGFTPLYTTLPQRTWVEITDDELELILKRSPIQAKYGDIVALSLAVEAKLKQKNGFIEEKNT